MKDIRIFHVKNCHFLVVKFSVYLNRRVFVMSKNISIYAIFNDQSFNDTLTNDIVSFEQLDPGLQNHLKVKRISLNLSKSKFCVLLKVEDLRNSRKYRRYLRGKHNPCTLTLSTMGKIHCR